MILENGSGISNADSYCSIEEADQYNEGRGNIKWLFSIKSEKEASLVRACDYIEKAYGELWLGSKCTETQRLSYPRFGITDSGKNQIPRWLKEAQCEGALLELEDTGILSWDESEGGRLTKEREGEIEKSYTQGPSSVRKFPQIYGLIKAHIKSPSQIGIMRA